eukprot:TRINITY_DN12607_c0_g1_i3.p1 TRINITY_DN12607_c0_g1~~TRINITY_DN12607_c0_g1_i3.p1  ORF type:complete len:439 (+),score=12.08 TRINITY_DN12607_c0_g1_i3:2016-3332(+)
MFDSMCHKELMNILRKRIKDERFLNVIWKFLKSGYYEPKSDKDKKQILVKPNVGSPQGNVFSPILCNIYLHELDKFILKRTNEYRTKHNRKITGRIKGKDGRIRTPLTKEYRRLSDKIAYNSRLLRNKNYKTEERKKEIVERLAAARKERTALPTSIDTSKKILNFAYCRYADDWVLSISGPRGYGLKLKHDIRVFLQCKLKLKLSPEKTLLTNIFDKPVTFLSFNIRRPNQWVKTRSASQSTRVKSGPRPSYRKVKMKVSHNHIKITAPISLIIKRLNLKGICDPLGRPTPVRAWFSHPSIDIIRTFNAQLRGYLEYYRAVSNTAALMRIQYIIQQSAALTLCAKYKTRKTKLYKRITSNLHIRDTVHQNFRTVVRKASITRFKFKYLHQFKDKWRTPIYYNMPEPSRDLIRRAYKQPNPRGCKHYKRHPFFSTLHF